jgi:plastocyanin domain-containing protein
MRMRLTYLALAGLVGTAAAAPAPITLTIQNHIFTPSRIELSANQRTVITVKNLDATAEEFESPGLKIEKVVPAQGEITVRVLPLGPGNYTFIGEYHEKTARGLAVVR